MGRLDGKVTVITGGSGVIGMAAEKLFITEAQRTQSGECQFKQ